VSKVHAERAMSERRSDGVFEIVDVVAAIFAAVAIVDPGVRVLMHEERHADRGEVSLAFVTITIAPQRVPRCGGDRMHWRSNREHVKNRVFAVSVPARFQKAGLRFPAVREQGLVTVEHPAKVDAFVDSRGEPHDLRVGGEALPGGEHTCEQQRGVDR
jgi:hypothetical protein